MPELPIGTVTFLFTDVEGSTRLLQELGEEYASVLAEHRRVLREAFARYGGVEAGAHGDAGSLGSAAAPSGRRARARTGRGAPADASVPACHADRGRRFRQDTLGGPRGRRAGGGLQGWRLVRGARRAERSRIGSTDDRFDYRCKGRSDRVSGFEAAIARTRQR